MERFIFGILRYLKRSSSARMEMKTAGDLFPASARGKADFSVAFGSFGCRGSAGGLAPFVPQARRLSAGGTIFKGHPKTCSAAGNF